MNRQAATRRTFQRGTGYALFLREFPVNANEEKMNAVGLPKSGKQLKKVVKVKVETCWLL